jgi:hypothetical protein
MSSLDRYMVERATPVFDKQAVHVGGFLIAAYQNELMVSRVRGVDMFHIVASGDDPKIHALAGYCYQRSQHTKSMLIPAKYKRLFKKVQHTLHEGIFLHVPCTPASSSAVLHVACRIRRAEPIKRR